jgi:TonB family protein
MVTWQRTAGAVALLMFAVTAGLRAQDSAAPSNPPTKSAQPTSQSQQEQGSPAPTEDSQRIRVGGKVEAAALVHQVTPVYPQLAKQAHISGTVVLHCIIAKDGSVRQLEYVSGPPLLLKSAMDAVRQWVYKPTLVNGKPKEVDTTVTVVFTLGDDPKNSTTG